MILSKESISHAKFDVFIANPYIQDCDLSNMLIEASENGINVQIITRLPQDRHPEYLEKKQDYHLKLKQEGTSLFYDADTILSRSSPLPLRQKSVAQD